VISLLHWPSMAQESHVLRSWPAPRPPFLDTEMTMDLQKGLRDIDPRNMRVCEEPVS
jgi:hypothetical protein